MTNEERMKSDFNLTDDEMIATLDKANAKLRSFKNQSDTQLLERFYAFAEMFEIIGAAVFVKDIEGKYVLVNEKWEELTYIKTEETIGCHDIDLFPESISKVFALEDQKVLHDGTASSSKGSFLFDFQTKHLVSLRFPITNAEKKMIGFCGIVTETSRQNTLEQRLAKLARCMLTFTADHLQNINNLVALAGEEFQAACALYNKLENKQLCAIGQWNAPEGFQSESAPEGHICFDVIQQGNDEVTVLQNLDQSIYAQTDPSVAAFQLVSYIGVPVKSKGKTLGSLCLVYQYKFIPTASDLDFFKLIAYTVSNEETRQDDELIISESDNKFSKLLMEIPSMAVQGINQAGKVISWTKTSEEFYGYSAQEAIGEYIWDLIVPDEMKNHVKDIIRNTFSQQRPSEVFEFQTKRKDGSKFWVQTSQTHVSLPRKEPFLFSFDQDITDRKLAEAKIRESEENYRNLFNNAQVGLFKVDLMTPKTIDCNDKLAKMGGYDSREEMIATDIALNNYVDPKVREKMLKEFKEFGSVNNFEAQFYRKDRSKFWLNFSFRLNKEKGWVEGAAVDITDQKNAQKALVESEANIKAIVESSLDSVWSINANYEIEYINKVFTDEFYQTFGKKLIKGSNILRALPQPMFKVWKERYDLVFRGEQITFVEEIKVGRNSTFIEVLMQPIIIEHVVKGVSTYARNITEKAVADKLLKYQAEMRKLLVKFSSSFINLPLHMLKNGIQTSLEKLGTFVGADRSYIFFYDFENKLGRYSYEWCNEGIASFIHIFPIIPLEDFRHFVHEHQQGHHLQLENIDFVRDNELHELFSLQDIKSLATTPLMRGDECIGFIGFDMVRNYRVFEAHEFQLIDVYAQMIVNVVERMEQEQQLIDAKEKAVESDQLKTAFLQNMSHEIRTPMNGILGFVDLLKEPDLTFEEKAKYISIIEKSSNRLLNTINDILEISKIEAGQEEVQLSSVNVNEVLHYFYDFFKPMADERGVRLILGRHLESTSSIILTDKHKLETVMVNLINNALKFTFKGFVEFGSYLEDNKLKFYVKDSGIGIPLDRQASIYERFVQADLNITRPHEGSGLGLAIVKAFLAMLGGEIYLKSEEGRGTTFRVTLPYNPADFKELKHKTLKAEKLSQTPITALVAEDDDVSYLIMNMMLQKENIKTIRTLNGEDTITAVKTHPEITFVLMDIKMPKMNGLESTKEIRHFQPRLPIIAQTSYAMPGDREKALASGCDEYISKPIDRNELFKIIYKLLKEKQI